MIDRPAGGAEAGRPFGARPLGARPLGADDVRIWYARDDGMSDRHEAAFAAVLDDTERATADRFHADEDRRRYVCAHALLRCALGFVSGENARRLRFRTDAHGKPELDAPGQDPPLRFNLSHTRGLVCCAVAWGREIGVDAERTDRGVDVDLMAGRFFAPDEVAALRRLDPVARGDRFTAIWSLKEAVVKAVGRGLAIPLDGFSIDLDPPGMRIHEALRSDPGFGREADWDLRQTWPVPGLVLSVAVRRDPASPVRCELEPVALDTLARCCARFADG